MDLGAYISACREQLRELKESLSEEETEALFYECAELGRCRWKKWCAENDSDIHAFAGQTPSGRAQRKKWMAPEVRQRLVLAAYQYLYQGLAVLTVIDEASLWPGGSYRSTSAAAGMAYDHLVNGVRVREWPFDRNNPFDSWPG